MQRFTLKDAINSWIFKRLNKVSKNTTGLNNQGLNYFMSLIGKTYPLNSINNNHIEKFIIYLESQDKLAVMSPTIGLLIPTSENTLSINALASVTSYPLCNT